MQTEELVFDVINTLSYPVLILEESQEKKWVYSYRNQAMQKLLNNKETKENDTDEVSLPKSEYENSLEDILSTYTNELHSDSFTLHDIEIFDGLYNVSFNKNQNRLLIIFVETPIEELFDNITFHDLSGACNAIVLVLDNEGKIVDVNECFLDLVGMNKEDTTGKSFFETFIPGDIKQLNHYFENILSNETYSQKFVTPLKGLDDKLYRINWQVSKLVKNDQTYIIAVGSDISKFVEENSDLKNELKSIRIGFDYFPLAIGYMNYKGIFTKMNPRFMKMFKIKEDHEEVLFDNILLFKKHIGFDSLNENIQLIKEMSYKIDYTLNEKPIKIKVDIRLLHGKKESSNFYIVVVQMIG